MALFLRSKDVEDLIDLRRAVEITEQVFSDQAAHGTTAWAPVHLQASGVMLMARWGALDARKRFGLRVTTGPRTPSVALLFEAPGGLLDAIVAYPFSEVRLAATVAIGLGRLAPAEARTVGLLGSGRNALGLLEAARLVRPIESVRVYSPTRDHREAFAKRASQHLGIPVESVDEPRAAVEGAQIVITATSSTEPAIRGEWLAPGAHVTSIADPEELDEETFLRAELIVTTSKVHELNPHSIKDHWPLVSLSRAGKLNLDRDVHELGEVVAGKVAPQGGITVFREARGGFGDIALAAYAYERARELGRGTELVLD